ncbi:hypothetical protein [Streptomyces sp. NPDC015350]|uniref:hypothetical protein n=1 Tax=Streptomyces sp. NPDC015350 TaxID=3364955 RepID=UPI0036FAF57A
MAWNEWEQIKTEAARQRPTHMQTNGVGGSAGASGGAADLVVNQDDLGAVGHEAYLLRSRLSRDGDHARSATFDAAIALTNGNFTSGAQLLKVHDRWNNQLRTLLDACARISDHLDYSKSVHAGNDADIGGKLLSVSEISKYYE